MHVSVISSRLKFETSARKNMVGQGGGRLQVFDIDKNFMEKKLWSVFRTSIQQ